MQHILKYVIETAIVMNTDFQNPNFLLKKNQVTMQYFYTEDLKEVLLTRI